MIDLDTSLVHRLKAADRSRSVLILGGTGINFWYYYPLLRQFSLEELKQFKAVYGFSGGSGAYWFDCLAQRGQLYEDRVRHYDQRMRLTLNRYGLWRRLARLTRNDYLYHGDDLVSLMAQYVAPEALEYRFGDFEMRNFHVVGHDLGTGQPMVFSARKTSEVPIAQAVAGSAFPRFLGSRRFCHGPEGYVNLSDIEFAGKEVKRGLIEQLKADHSEDLIYFLNLFKSGQKGNVCKIKVAKTRFPGLEQAADLCRAFLNWRNPRYRPNIRRQRLIRGLAVGRRGDRWTCVFNTLPPHAIHADGLWRHSAGERLRIQVLGSASIAGDVSPELARATIESVTVLGLLQASPAVKAALADRMG